MDPSALLLDIQELTKTYPIMKEKSENNPESSTFIALNNVSFQLRKGEVTGIIGSNGAGKSTLLKILSEVIPPTSGRVLVYGKVVSILEVGTGFHPDLSGYENIFLNAAILGMKRAEINEQINNIIEFSGVKAFIHEPVKNYSSGMYLRLAMSVALHVNCDLLLLDEVIAVGDASFRKKALEKIQEKIKSGMSCLLISHDMQVILNLCKSCLWLDKGCIQQIGPTSIVVSAYLNAIGYDGQCEIKSYVEHYSLISLTSSATEIYTDQGFTITIKFKVDRPDRYVALMRTSFQQQAIFTDALVFRSPKPPNLIEAGTYETTITIPPNILNAGCFIFDFILGTQEELMVDVKRGVVLTVNHREWELNKNWNSSDRIYPLRPQFEWQVNKLE